MENKGGWVAKLVKVACTHHEERVVMDLRVGGAELLLGQHRDTVHLLTSIRIQAAIDIYHCFQSFLTALFEVASSILVV